MNNPTPALVTQRAAQRLPRTALLLFCAAYLLPGLIGRDPWRGADITAFGYMAAMAEGRTPWLEPTVGGLPLDNALLPHWLGAGFITLLGPVLGSPMAARLPFALLLAASLALVWYSTFHLARTEAAQPVAFAFGGEASAVDYARALADGATLALMATLGLLQLGHETTPELAQLASMALAIWGLSAAPYRVARARLAILVALPLMAASGAPGIAVATGLAGAVLCRKSAYPQARAFAPWVMAAAVLALLAALALHTNAWRVRFEPTLEQVAQIGRLWGWFLWPVWLIAPWTVWRWRHHLLNRHITVPLATASIGLVASVVMGGSDRALMLALPGLAVLAAFALPTLQRSTSGAIDWFSVFFFSACAITVWVIYSAVQLGVPAKPAANVAKLVVGYEPSFAALPFALAAVGSLAWSWLVRWRTGRHRAALWKSMVLPAGGVALVWLLLMTLWLPLLDHARSERPWVERLSRHVQGAECIAAPGLARGALAALEHHGRWRVDARPGAAQRCPLLLVAQRTNAAPPAREGWMFVARVRRPTERGEGTLVYRRSGR